MTLTTAMQERITDTGYEVAPTTLRDITCLAPRLRKQDADEIYALRGMQPLEALTECYRSSHRCITARFNGNAYAMFGTVRVDDDHANIWLLGSHEIKHHRREFLKQSRRWLDELHAEFVTLSNHVDARNTEHIRWIRWLGFNVDEGPVSIGHEGRPFYYFSTNQSK